MSQESIEKNYFDSLIAGHYIDVKYSDQEWKIAKIIERDKRYALVAFDAINAKEEQVYLQSYRVAPLRTHTEGYTGSIYRAYRAQQTPVNNYKNHLEILQQTYCSDNLPSAFTITQYLRGELFVLIHSLLSREDVKEEDSSEAMAFLIGFLGFAFKMAQRVKQIASEYFEAIHFGKSSYICNEKVAFVQSLPQILVLVNYIVKAELSKHVALFKSKHMSQDALIKFFTDLRAQSLFRQLFNLNDGNGHWLSFGTHRHLYFLLKKFLPKFKLPEYRLKDCFEVLQIYPFIIREEEKANSIEQPYLIFLIRVLKQQTSFEAKLRSLLELKKIIEGQVKLYKYDERRVFDLIHQHQIIEHMISQQNFNPEIFKRFIPILSQYCKARFLPPKSIGQLFKLAANRHESEVLLIHEIICAVAEFAPNDSLDGIYAQILKNNLNNEQTLQFVENFTINAISNYSRQKSFLSSLFRKSKNSSRYGYYGLDLVFKEVQDEGCLVMKQLPRAFNSVRNLFNNALFQHERPKYVAMCIGWLQKHKNHGQSIRLIDFIISTYPSDAIFEDNKKEVLQRLIEKNDLLNKMLNGIMLNPNSKVSVPQRLKWVYEFIDGYYEYFVGQIHIGHIRLLWLAGEVKLFCDFIRKSRGDNKDGKRRWIKKLDERVQEEIINKLVFQEAFLKREFSIEQFEALDQIFISINLLKKKLEISERGYLRFLTLQLQGLDFYFSSITRLARSPAIDKVLKKTFNIFLRPRDQKNLAAKMTAWSSCLLKTVDHLKDVPQSCLRAINLFFEAIQGVMVKEGSSLVGKIEIIVQYGSIEKVITLARNCTLFRMRKQIMVDFNLLGDFTMYSANMRRNITFIEEEQFSLNALPLELKGPSIIVLHPRNEKHIQLLAIEQFRAIIQKEESFYSILFSLNSEQASEYFWKTVELLPVNRLLVKKIEHCEAFTGGDWKRLLKLQANSSLQYHLNIIHDLMERSKAWGALFNQTGGINLVLECLCDSLNCSLDERVVQRCLLIFVRLFEAIELPQPQFLEELNSTLIARLELSFNKDSNNSPISIQVLSLLFNLCNRILKTPVRFDVLEMELAFRVLDFVLFQPRTRSSLELIQVHLEYYLFNNYSSPPDKIKVYEILLKWLDLDTLTLHQHCELYFLFLVDYMNTFVEESEKAAIHQEVYLNRVTTFVMSALESAAKSPTRQDYNQIQFGALRLLLYQLNLKQHYFDLCATLGMLLSFLFGAGRQRFKHESTTKLFYQCVKKIIFSQPSLLQLMTSRLIPQLANNSWRKNMQSSWALQSRRQERNIYCGLQNLGATCYINCLLQQLFHIAQFREHFIGVDSAAYRAQPEENEILQFQMALMMLKYSNKRSVSLKRFCESFITYENAPINPMVQSDADEFFNALMEKLDNFLKAQHRHDVVANIFEGKLSNQLCCEGCPHSSEKQEHFLSIGVNIRGKASLHQALEGFVDGEILDGDNAYFCETCEKKVRTLKRLCFKDLPNVLIITLKRFEFNYDQMRKIKINSHLSFPFELDMRPFTAKYLAGECAEQDNFMYTLRGTVIHAGTSEGGHYYSFVKPEEKWFTFNDENVEQISAQRVEDDGFGGDEKDADYKFEKNKNAYMLFYQKCSPTPQYKRNPELPNDFSDMLKQEVLTENSSSDFLSIMLDGNFVRLCQNLSCLEGELSVQYTLLYFHTVVLRDRNKDQYIPNYYRIIKRLLQSETTSQWYLAQMNPRFIKEFLIEAPRTVRFVCVSLVLEAIAIVKQVSQDCLLNFLSCVKRNGMNPFGKIFKTMALSIDIREKMAQLQYPQRVISLILEQTNTNFKLLEIKPMQSFFGSDCSQKQKDRQVCFSALAQSLEYFSISYSETWALFEKHFSRNGSKALAKILAQQITLDQIGGVLKTLQSNIVRQSQFKREDLERYLFFLRYIIFNSEGSAWKIDESVESLKRVVYDSKACYQPLETILRELNYIASRHPEFRRKWITALNRKQVVDLIKCLKHWLKQAEKPQMLNKSEEFRRKVASLGPEERYQIEQKNRLGLQKRVSWMCNNEESNAELIQSDLQTQICNKELTIRNKKFKVKEHLGLIKKIEIEGEEKWGFLERNQLDVYSSL